MGSEEISSRLRRGFLVPLLVVAAGGVLALDLMSPLGVAAGVPYVLVVLISARLERPSRTAAVALSVTALTVLGAVLSPGVGAAAWIYLMNRGLALFAVWTVALTIMSRQRATIRANAPDRPE